MAGGIDWFRWHHGTVTDQKFPLIAKRSGASVAEVIAVWACFLEAASQNEEQRGMLASLPDFEAMDCALGVAEGRCEAIYQAMVSRTLVDEHLHLTAWPRRQPKREREDSTAAERQRRKRERDAGDHPDDPGPADAGGDAPPVTPGDDGQGGDTPGGADQSHVTPRHATSRQKSPRGEESRGEGSVPNGTDGASPPAAEDAAPKKPKIPEDIAKSELWRNAVLVLQAGGCKAESMCRTFMGKLVGDYTFDVVKDAVAAAVSAQPADAREYLKATCQSIAGERKRRTEAAVTVPSQDADKTAAYLATQALSAEEKERTREAARAFRLKAVS